MKKHILFAGLLIASLAFTACDEDYTDWASVQSNEQEEVSDQVSIKIETAANFIIKSDNITNNDSLISIAHVISSSIPEGTTVSYKDLKIQDISIPYTIDGSYLEVKYCDLDSFVTAFYDSKESVKRELTVKVTGAVTDEDGQGLQITSNDIIVSYYAMTTPDTEANYYIVGDFAGWDAASKIQMTYEGNYIFSYTTEISEAKYFKIFPESATAGDELNWANCLGTEVDGDDSDHNSLIWENANAIKTGITGKIKIILDVKNFTFTIQDNSAPTELYLTGSNYSWGGTWVPLVPVNSEKGGFWKMIYLNENEQIKFAPQADWGDDFGMEATIDDEAGATITNNGGNITCGVAGWYLLHITVVGTDRALTILSPNIYVIGDCSIGGWSNTLTDVDKFVVPESADDNFTSSTLNTGELRLCVKLSDDIDWWKSEFIVLDNTIAYRGNGGDQERVSAEAGQKVLLNFTTGIGSIE